jgi:hypothetical protein
VRTAGNVWSDGVSEKVVWHVVKYFAKKIGVANLAPHDLRRYAECRIMPNPNATARPGALWNGPPIEVGVENDAA